MVTSGSEKGVAAPKVNSHLKLMGIHDFSSWSSCSLKRGHPIEPFNRALA